MDSNKLSEIIKKYRENKMAHAYLIETNNQDACLKDLLEVVKAITCEKDFKSSCKECNLCNLIELNNLPTLKIIEPDGINIKKQQIQELKDSFSTKPVYSKHNIYIIKNSEKLNSASANTMLKFLEEPDGQVLGFFITNNKENILLTIQSRTQLIKALYNRIPSDDDKLETILDDLLIYIDAIEKKQELTILYNKKIIVDKLLKVVSVDYILKILLDIYQNALYYKIDEVNCFEKYNKFDCVLANSVDSLLKKINILMNCVNNSNYNLNTELMLDKMVLEMSGINE